MICIQSKEKQVLNRIPKLLLKKGAYLFLFQVISTFLLIYGITASVYLQKSSSNQKAKYVKNPYIDILVGCFCYLGLSVSGKFSGAQMNPSITIGKCYIQKNQNLAFYLTGQSIGGLVALLMGIFFLTKGFFIYDVNLAPYQTNQQTFFNCFNDMLGQIFGTFIFAFFIFVVTRKGYLSGQFFGYFSISASLLVSRAFTFRKGCLNPIIGLYSQIIIAVQKSNISLVLYSLPMIVGPILGGFFAAFVYKNFYSSLIDELKIEVNKGQKTQRLIAAEQKD